MKITLMCISKTNNNNLAALLKDYAKRIKNYSDFEIEYVVTPKNISKLQADELKKAEGRIVLQKIKKSDFLILLDERGKQYTSVNFATRIQKLMNAGYKQIYFLVGGAFGFSKDIYERADESISLSDMTTTHQLVRLFFTEQLYRAFTILKGHPYHNN
jgi:23S rRNA (pseudouridine1915-N3)-methyltransferase